MGKKMIPFSAELFEFLSGKINAYGFKTEIKKMFGHEVHFLNGYMYAGANMKGIFVHVGQGAKETALEQESGIFSFEPLEGMAMKEYLLLGEEIHTDEKRLRSWLEQGRAYLQSLPPKKQDKRKR
jgi:TfoX/Sxy family transcriptional regulator of competence genes